MTDRPDPELDDHVERRTGQGRRETDDLAALLREFNQSVIGLGNIIREAYLDREAAQRQERANRRRSIAAVVFAAFTLIAAASGTGFAGYNTIQNREVIERVDDCTTPSTRNEQHDCFERAGEATGAAIAQIRSDNAADNDRQTEAIIRAFNEWLAAVDPTVPPIEVPTGP